MSSYRPRLRAHWRVEGDHLRDALLERAYPLEDVAAALAPLLDGEREWPAIRDAVLAQGHDAVDVDAAFRRLLLLHAVEGSGDAMVAKLERVLRREEAVPTSILEGARFACQGSGGCCQGYRFGPLTDADVAALDALDLAAAFPHVAPPFVETAEGGRYLRREGDRCVFLTAERRCGLHAAFGPDAKPGFCRLYPIDSFATVEGIRVVDRGTCATFAVSARAGLPLVDDLARVRPLLQPPTLHHPTVMVDGWAWDYAAFLRFTTAATRIVRRNLATASETLLAIGRCLDALSLAASQCPLAPGQPDAMANAIVAMPDETWYRAPRRDRIAAGVRAVGDLLRALGAALTSTLANTEHSEVRASAARLAELAVLVERTAAALASDDDAAAADAAASPPPADEVDEALRISMRQQLFGRSVLVGARAGAGLVRIGLIQLLALAGARLDAGARALTAADLNRGHYLAVRGLESGTLDGVLIAHEPQWRLLLDGLAASALGFRGVAR